MYAKIPLTKITKMALVQTNGKKTVAQVKAASLWSVAADPAEEWPEWSQPVGAHDAYAAGDKVSHNDKKWKSTCDGNVWEPGVYGWTEETT